MYINYNNTFAVNWLERKF